MRLSFKLLALCVLLLTGFAAHGFAQLQGTYEVVGPVPAAHSLNTVKMEEFLNFTCPHCNNFREAAKPVYAKYGKRLQATYVPILFRGQSDTPLRLFFIAERQGRGEEMMGLIFDATFRYGVNINDPKIMSYVARSAGLADEFRDQYDAEWVQEKIRQAHLRADKFGIEATPTIVLNGSLRLVPQTGMQSFVSNLDRIIGQLLRKQS